MKILNKILSTIVAIPLALIGASLIIPFVALYYLIYLPVCVIRDVWLDNYEE
jgi:hypothetical protein